MEILTLTKSKLRRELLRLYFTNPDGKHYLRELERLLGYPVAYIRRELIKLNKEGIFQSERQGNLVYYFVNKSYPLYEEIKSMVFKTVGVEGSLREILSALKDIHSAFVFGSFAKAEEAVTSDIDLFLIGNPDEDLLIEKINDLEKKIHREINYHIYSARDFNKAKQEGDSFILNLIKQPKVFLIGDESALR
ncbi:hypothetical protein HKBW3S42_00191 [Candidatus Hakubella thermalkaliphila]|uniref:Polymerase beta nucleotidyltransferase domain-containing protein n=1 Tax=Candidatus Hakubella thermalkaliphila TaxID=2754717 RepID=A0A6V8PGV4_9ACTN|nr:hypothetical protein HKBW3S42_00191 [Candidatus Hakubella thermalkaliphila]GFP42389.1 hypothetical protein HKBW3C_01515 [Candidatus Hakubella thermalkaliphila]